MRIENPVFIATHQLVWLRADGSQVPVTAAIGQPYQGEIDWACPVMLAGIDGRYGDIVGISSMQALNLARAMFRRRLGHMLERGEILANPGDGAVRWNVAALDAVFGDQQ